MFSVKEIEGLIFLDLETAPVTDRYEMLSPVLRKHWERRAERMHWNEAMPDPAESFAERSGVFAEYARIVCMTCGFLRFQDGQPVATIKTIFNEDERKLLEDTRTLFGQIFAPPHQDRRLCGHNLREFDLPFLGRRMLVHRLLPLPAPLQVYGKKPWEINHVDTMDFWRFADVKTFTSLEILADLFGIESPKVTMNGADVGRAFWQEKRHDDIQRYCEADVLATMQIVLHVSNQPLLPSA